MTRQVCPQHEKALKVCDCSCTCQRSRHVALGIKGTHHDTECRLPNLVPQGTREPR